MSGEPLLDVSEDGYTFRVPPERWPDWALAKALKGLEGSISNQAAAYEELLAERDRRVPAYVALVEALDGLPE
jgi:hypothetical protein